MGEQISNHHQSSLLRFNELKDALKTVDSLIQDVKARIAESAETHEQLRSVVGRLAAIAVKRESIKRDQAVLKSLKYDQFSERHEAIHQAHKSTFAWIYDSSFESRVKPHHFLDWLQREDGFFWIRGKPGSGKSTLMKFIADHERTKEALSEWAGSSTVMTASHYFWNSGSTLQHSYDGLLRSILLQVFSKVPELISPVCEEEEWWSHHKNGTIDTRIVSLAWPVSMLTRCLERLATTEKLPVNVKFCFFIDGLDEYDGGHENSRDMCESLKLLTATSSRIKICFSSQPLGTFEKCFGNDPYRVLSIHDLTVPDIRRFARGKLSDYPEWSTIDPDGTIVETFLREIENRAEGVFLWVSIVVGELCKGLFNHDSPAELRRRLDETPSNLEAYFRQILDRVEEHYQPRRDEFIRIALTASINPLEREIYAFHDISFDDPDPQQRLSEESYEELLRQLPNRMQTITGGLLEVATQNNKVDFLHRTVKVYLEKYVRTVPNKCRWGFNPNVAILRAHVSKLQVAPLIKLNPRMSQCDMFNDVADQLMGLLGLYGQKADSQDASETKIVLDAWERTLLQTLPSYHVAWEKTLLPLPSYPARVSAGDAFSIAADQVFGWATNVANERRLRFFQGSNRGLILSSIFRLLTIEQGLSNYVVMKVAEDPSYITGLPVPPLQVALRFAEFGSTAGCREKHMSMVKILLDQGYDPNAAPGRSESADEIVLSPWLNLVSHFQDNTQSVLTAIRDGLFKVLLDAGADPNAMVATKLRSFEDRQDYLPAWVHILLCCLANTISLQAFEWQGYYSWIHDWKGSYICADLLGGMFSAGADITLFHNPGPGTEATPGVFSDGWERLKEHIDEVEEGWIHYAIPREHVCFAWHMLCALAKAEVLSGKRVIPWDEVKPQLKRLQERYSLPHGLRRRLTDVIGPLEEETGI